VTDRALVVFVHGLWMPGPESRLFRNRLEASFNFATQVFAYRSTRESLAAVLDRLRAQIERAAPTALHLVGHSLGGIVVLRFFEKFPQQPPGRVVLLGTPLRGSLAAQRVDRFAFAHAMLGQIAIDELLGADSSERRRHWPHERELGLIAGTRSVGFGRLFAQFTEPNDGTVAASECDIEGAADRIVLPVSHLGMMLSRRIVDETGRFLRAGRFSLQGS
jgi:pimeloyl-ACP methyl ester carboxylesterase